MLECIVIIMALLLDQGTKIWAASTLPQLEGQSMPIWDGVFHFSYHENRGAAFSILQGKQVFLLVISIVAIAALVYILLRYRKRWGKWMRVAFALMIAGAAGNLIDRIWLGYVRDFIDVRLIHFPVFNVADSCLVVAVIMLLIAVFFFPESAGIETSKKEGKNDKESVTIVEVSEPDEKEK